MKRLILVLVCAAIGAAIILSCSSDKSKPTEPGDDTTAPTIVSTSPTSSATNVPISTSISATFSEAINSATVTATSFTLSAGITGAVAYSDKVATFTPTTSLATGTQYTATLSTAIKDQSGNPLSGAYSWSFTTATAPGDTVPPAMITDLEILDVTAHYAILSWTMPGDDSVTGTASVYVIKYNTVSINASNWDASVQYGGSTTLKAAGSIEVDTVKNLDENTEYYFAIRVRDDAGNWSGVSSSPAQSTLVGGLAFGIYSDYQVGNAYTYISSIDVGDIDEDGDQDILVGDGQPDRAIYIGFNNGSGLISFSRRIEVEDPVHPQSNTYYPVQVKIGYGIGNWPSIVMCYSDPKEFGTLLKRNGNLDSLISRMYDNTSGFTIYPAPQLLGVGDIDGDGDADIALGGDGSTGIEVFYNSSTVFNMTSPVGYPIGGTPKDFVVGDFDEDGMADMAAGIKESPSLNIVFGRSTASGISRTLASGSVITSVATGNLDGGSGDDVVVTTVDSVYVFLSQGGSFPNHQSYSVGYAWGVISADFDKDGDEDIIVGIQDGLFFLKNDGLGSFQRADRFDTIISLVDMLKAADFDGDGDDDIVMRAYSRSQGGLPRLYRFTNYHQ